MQHFPRYEYDYDYEYLYLRHLLLLGGRFSPSPSVDNYPCIRGQQVCVTTAIVLFGQLDDSGFWGWVGGC